MNLLQLWTLLTSLDTKTLLLGIVLVLIAINQGWLHIQGIKIKKKEKEKTPKYCLYGRSGSCQLMELQMDYTESVMEEIKSKAYSHYLKVRKEKLGGKEELSADRDAHHYNSVLYQLSDKTKNLIRYFFRENHLAKMDDATFKLHKQKRIKKIMNYLTETLSLLYYPGSNPDRIELYDYQMEHLGPSIEIAIDDVFNKGRELAIKFQNGILDNQINDGNFGGIRDV